MCALVFFFFFFFFFSLYTSQFRDLQHPTLFLVAECELYSEHQSENAREGEDLKAQEEKTHTSCFGLRVCFRALLFLGLVDRFQKSLDKRHDMT